MIATRMDEVALIEEMMPLLSTAADSLQAPLLAIEGCRANSRRDNPRPQRVSRHVLRRRNKR